MKLKNNYYIYTRYEKTGSKTLIKEIFSKYFHYHSLIINKKLFDKFIEDKENNFLNETFIINIQIQRNIIKKNLINFDSKNYYDNILSFLKYIKKKYNLKIILGIRAQKDIIESYYSQLAKNGYFISKKKFYKTHYKIWKYYEIIRNFYEIFSKENVHIFILNNNLLDNEFKNLFFFLTNKKRVFKKIKKLNRRRSHNKVKLYMFFNFLRFRGANKFIKISVLEKIIYIMSNILDKISHESNKNDYYKEYLSLYIDDNRKIEKNFKLNLRERGFEL